jgi:hypothetical protein
VWSRVPTGLKLAAIVSVAAAALFIAIPLLVDDPLDEARERLRARVSPARTEDELVREMGPPFRVVTPGLTDKTCRLEGWSFDSRPISHRCLIYRGDLDLVAYVYVDQDGRIEGAHLGGS